MAIITLEGDDICCLLNLLEEVDIVEDVARITSSSLNTIVQNLRGYVYQEQTKNNSQVLLRSQQFVHLFELYTALDFCCNDDSSSLGIALTEVENIIQRYNWKPLWDEAYELVTKKGLTLDIVFENLSYHLRDGEIHRIVQLRKAQEQQNAGTREDQQREHNQQVRTADEQLDDWELPQCSEGESQLLNDSSEAEADTSMGQGRTRGVNAGYRPYPCDFGGCGKSFKRREVLEKHLLIHTGEKPFVCQYPGCTMKFRQLPHLKQHMVTHTGEKPFTCQEPGCDKRFATSRGLRQHAVCHSDVRPFLCYHPGCERDFKRSQGLQKHLRAHMRKSTSRSQDAEAFLVAEEEDDEEIEEDVDEEVDEEIDMRDEDAINALFAELQGTIAPVQQASGVQGNIESIHQVAGRKRNFEETLP